MDTETLCRFLLGRMQEIDSDITKSRYSAAVHKRLDQTPPTDDSQDRPPTGDDYNLLWDAVIEEIQVACPHLDIQLELESNEPTEEEEYTWEPYGDRGTARLRISGRGWLYRTESYGKADPTTGNAPITGVAMTYVPD